MSNGMIERAASSFIVIIALAWSAGGAPAEAVEEEVTIPHTFSTGTKARASEVNANFAVVAAAAEANAVQGNENATKIGVLEGALGDVEATLEALVPPSNLITVGKDGADFTSVAEALSNTGAASESNPMLVHVLPGVFEETELLFVPSFVRLQGSGRGTTVIRASRSSSSQGDSTSTVVELEDRAMLNDLSIENLGTDGTFASGVLVSDASRATIVENVEISVEGDGGTGHIALRATESDIAIVHSELRASGASTLNAALAVVDSTGPFSLPLVKDSLLEGKGVNSGFGIFMSNTAAEVRDSEVTGDFRAISTTTAGLSRIKDSRLSTLGLSPVHEQTGAAALIFDSVVFEGGNPVGIGANFKYVHCVKANFDPVVNGAGSGIE